MTVDRRAPPLLGKGRFVVTAPLGDGGTSGVYLAWDHASSGWVAVKVLLNQFLADTEMRQRFRAEAATMAKLRHPNIAELVHHDMDATPPYLVMELARCGSVMGWVKKNGPMPPTLAVDVLLQMCDALAAAHAAGVVHRDVKPHNFLMDDRGVCKLTDFGIARVDEHTAMTATGSQIGTFSFMPPEQRSSTKAVDHRADIYALGASLYTMLVARTSAELFIAEDDPSILADVPPAFRPVILGACRYKPDERFPDMEEFHARLLDALSRLPSSAEDYPPLVEPAEPLPAGPPAWLPEGVRFDDLAKSMALDLDNPTFVPPKPTRQAMDAGQEHTGRTRGSSYGMSRPDPSAAPQGVPDYLDPAERARENARLARSAADRAVNLALPAQVAAPPPAEPSRALEYALYAGVVVVLLAVGSVGGAGLWVGMGRSATESASERFSEVIRSESSVVYELGGDRRFEELYVQWEQAKGPARVAAAVAFADALERVASDSTSVDPRVEQRVRRILEARDQYSAAYDDWRARASGFPGSLAVSLGLASPPVS